MQTYPLSTHEISIDLKIIKKKKKKKRKRKEHPFLNLEATEVILNFNILWANSHDDKLMIFFFFFFFFLFFSFGDNLQELSACCISQKNSLTFHANCLQMRK